MTVKHNDSDFRQASTAHAFIRLMKEVEVPREKVEAVVLRFIEDWKLDDTWSKDLDEMITSQFCE